MNQSRKQKTITITEFEKDFIIKNYKRLKIREIARQLEMGFGKCYQHMILLGLNKPRSSVNEIPIPADTFDVDLFSKYYKY
jgi:hypothetical protein